MAFTSINDSIINTHINNNSSCNLSIALKISGKGLRDTSNASNIYDNNGIGLQLWSNTINNRELAIIDTLNATNSNYATLRLGITQSGATIRSITSNNIIRPLVINDFLTITSNRVGIGTANPLNGLDVRGNITLDGNLLRSDGSLFTNSQWSNSTINSNNIFYNLGNIGIGTTNPIAALDIRNGNVILNNNSRIGIGLTNPQYAIDINNGNVNIGGNLLISLNNTTNNFNIYTASSNSITISSNTTADLLLVGAGGNGGSGPLSGGGGAGEVIYYPNYLFTSGTYSFIVGSSSANTSNRITRITFNNNDIIRALGGGDGGFNTYVVFNYTGSIQIFNIPQGITNINIYCWGAGGASTFSTGEGGGYTAGTGGTGGFIKANLNVSSISSLAIIVGQGGRKGVNNNFSGTAFGGGGSGCCGNDEWNVGGGGGLSGIFINDANMTILESYRVNPNATAIIVAGGGGSAGSTRGSSLHGGNGGSYGNNGNNATGSFAGEGGNQTSGGVLGEIDGAKYQGGNVVILNFLTGGGAGWFGGSTGNMIGGTVGAAGGGSSYLNSSYSITSLTSGTNPSNGTTVAGNQEFYYQSGIAIGGAGTSYATLTNGGNGLVIIEYISNNQPTSGGSGGGGLGGTLIQTGAIAGTKWNNNYSYVNSGNPGTTLKGGDGGSAAAGGYTELLTGSNLNVGIGGSGALNVISPIIKNTFGSGGDGGGGIGANGIIIIRYISKTIGLGIGTTLPLSALDVRGNIIVSGSIVKTDGSLYNPSLLNTSKWTSTSNITSNIFYNLGNVGIGTNNPQSALDVRGNITYTGTIIKSGSGTFTSTQWSNSSFNNIFYNIGNIGIGITNPQSLLHLSSPNSNNDIIIRFTDSTTGYTSNSGFIIRKDTSQSGVLWNHQNTSLLFGTSNIERLRISSNGNIGIGITNPQSLLHLATFTSNAAINIQFTDATTGNTATDGFIIQKDSSQNAVLWNYENTDLIIGNNNTERLRIKNSGNVGIGTTNPLSLLHLYKSGTSQEVFLLFNDQSTGGNSNNGVAVGKSSDNSAILWNYQNTSLLLGTNNIERLRISSNGNIGIGTTNPQSLLHLAATTTNTSINIQFTDATTGNTATDGFIIQKDTSQNGVLWNYENADLIFGNNNTERLRIKNSGNVGIGTINPSSLLHLYKSGTAQEVLLLFNDQGTGSSSTNGVVVGKATDNSAILWNYQNTSLLFGTNNSERLRISSNGNIGIGTTNPQSLLHLAAPTVNTAINIQFTDATTGNTATDGFIVQKDSSQNAVLWNYENADLIFGNTNTERLRIKNSGNVGIGTNNPSSLLHLYKSGTSQEVLLLFNDQGTGSGSTNGVAVGKATDNSAILWNYQNTPLLFGTNNSERLRIANNGNIGIGTTNPQYLLDVNGNINCEGGIAITGANAFLYTTNIDNENLNNTYITFKSANSISDWCYLRQIGSSDTYKLSFDFYDNINDNRFAIRYISPNAGVDTVKEVFTVDGNIVHANKLQLNGENTINTIFQPSGNLGIGVNNTANYINFNIGTTNEIMRITNNIVSITAGRRLVFTSTSLNNPSIGIYGNQNGDRIIFRQGSGGSYPISIGIGASALWYSVPVNMAHTFYINGSEIININSSSFNIRNNLEISHANNPRISFTSFGNTDIGVANTNGTYSTSAVSGDMVIRSQAGKNLILQNDSAAGHLIINNGKIGLGTATPQTALDVKGDITLSGQLLKPDGSLYEIQNANLVNNSSSNLVFKTSANTSILPSYRDDSNIYYLYEENSTINFTANTYCDILVVGAGGNGGFGAYSGGGGAGEVIYYPNYLFNAGNYNLIIGSNSIYSNDLITKFIYNSTNIIRALGGGNGSYFYFTITITNIGSILINQQITFTLYYNSMFRTDFQDLRFIDSDTNKQLNYFIDNINIGISADVWILIPLLGSNKIINITSGNALYYGNPYNVFDFYDNFYTFNTANTWDILSGTVNVSSNILNIYGDANKTEIVTKNNIALPIDYTAELNMFASGGIPELVFRYNNLNNYGISCRYDTRGPAANYGMGVILTNPNRLWAELYYPAQASIFPKGTTVRKTKTTIIGNVISSYYAASETDNYTLISSYNFGTSPQYNTNGKFGLQNVTDSNAIFYVKNLKIYKATSNIITISSNTTINYMLSSNGGGGSGGSIIKQGAAAGVKWNNTYSYFNNGYDGTLSKGGDGASAVNGGFIEQITGLNLNIGLGGIGVGTMPNFFPVIEKAYGAGGDGGGGVGGNGVIIIKPVNTRTISVSDTKLISLNVSNINNCIIQNTVYPYLSTSLYPLNYIHNNYGYYIITSNTSIIFRKDTTVDLLVVGCGGNGGLGTLSGGGGAGEIIYYPDYLFNYGNYDIQIGSNHSNPDLKNTRIYDNYNKNYIIAKGGGDGVGNNTNPIITVASGSVPTPISVSGSTTERYILFENSGSITFRVNTLASFVLIGGGGSGGGNNSATSPGAGGGAGQYIYSNNLYIPAYNTLNITIGSGGVNVANSVVGANGNSSYIIINNMNYTALGGGGAILGGASGGGNGGFASIFGVTGYNGGSNGAGAGGGGAGGSGVNYSGTTGGGGGSGINMNITGTIMQVSGGGSGGSIITTASTGAIFGGGQGGGSSGINGRDATSYGSGGGGAGYSSTSTAGSGGAGKSGVFIIRYANINYTDEQYRSTNCNIGSGGGSYIGGASITKGTNWDVKYSLLNNGNVGSSIFGGSGGSALVNQGYREILTETNILVGIGGNGATGSSTPVIKTNYGSGGDGNGGLGKEGVVIIKFPIENITSYDGHYLLDDNYYVKANETGFIRNYNTNNIYYNRGFVGIGISTPIASLHVNSNIILSGNISNTNQSGFIIQSPTSIRFAINNDTTSNIEIFRGSTIFRRQNVSIIGNLTVSGNIEVNTGCNINITGGGFYQSNNINLANTTTTFSDYRIKTNIVDINDNNALQQILAIKPKTFNYIDSNERGSNLVYGFIAQDVKEVIPQAVKIETQYVPNIYKSYDYMNNEIIINEDINDKLVLNDKILLRDDDNYYKSAMITYISSNIIKVDIDIKGDHCFIYGKEISDFHTLDKTYIYTLNVCATQDLYKLIEQQQSNIDIIKTKIIDRQSNINQIYQLLQ